MKMMAGIMLIVIASGVGSAVASDDVTQAGIEQTLGRVFLTTAERRRLDEQRSAGPVKQFSAGSKRAASSAPPTRLNRAAGYIVVPSGARSTWRDGEFHISDNSSSTPTIDFPGRVSIAVHDAPTPPVNESSPAAQDQESPLSTIPSGGRE